MAGPLSPPHVYFLGHLKKKNEGKNILKNEKKLKFPKIIYQRNDTDFLFFSFLLGSNY